jgi:hypothetical protein
MLQLYDPTFRARNPTTSADRPRRGSHFAAAPPQLRMRAAHQFEPQCECLTLHQRSWSSPIASCCEAAGHGGQVARSARPQQVRSFWGGAISAQGSRPSVEGGLITVQSGDGELFAAENSQQAVSPLALRPRIQDDSLIHAA